MPSVNNRGYLNEDYRLFHSTDRRDLDFYTHSHDFHKLVLCLDGRVTYIMEGVTYYLRPWDMLLIPEHQIHQSILYSTERYERIILWISERFFRKYAEPALSEVFVWPVRSRSGLFRPEESARAALYEKLSALETAQKSTAAGHALLADSYMIQFLLQLRSLLPDGPSMPRSDVKSDPRFNEILDYINANLSEDLSIGALAGRFYISQSHLMHAFKRHAGLTVHQYVLQKRLIQAAARIRGGEPVISTAQSCGFSDYTAFLKAFKRQYGCAPAEMKK